MQCGKELSEAQELIEKLEQQLEETSEQKRILQIQNQALKSENLGELVAKAGNFKNQEGLS